MYARRLVFGYFFLAALSFGAVYISGINILAPLWGSILAYSIIIYIFRKLFTLIRARPHEEFLHFFITFVYKVSVSLSIFILLFGSFVIFQNNILPAKLPEYTISNGEKTIIFQAMSHIASESFYKVVEKNILQAKKEGFVLFYEGVRPGTKENTQAFNAGLGLDFAPGLYDNLSRLYGVIAQDNTRFLQLGNAQDYNIDLSLDEIMEIYNNKQNKTKKTESLLENPQIQDINSEILHTLAQLNPKELFILRAVNQSLLNFMIKHESLRNKLIESIGKEDLFSVILDDRNKNLVDEIQKTTHKKIYISYGLMHFNGVLKLLKENDPHYEIIGKKSIQVIRNVDSTLHSDN